MFFQFLKHRQWETYYTFTEKKTKKNLSTSMKCQSWWDSLIIKITKRAENDINAFTKLNLSKFE